MSTLRITDELWLHGNYSYRESLIREAVKNLWEIEVPERFYRDCVTIMEYIYWDLNPGANVVKMPKIRIVELIKE